MPMSTRQISIEIIGRGAICSALPEFALSTMKYREQSFHFHGGNGTWRETGFRLFDTSACGETIIPAGSVARLEQELRRQGFEVTVEDRTQLPPSIRDFDRSFYEELDPNQRQRCDRIVGHRQFVLAASREARSATMGMVCRLFPKAKILIVAPTANTDECNSIFADLEWAMGGNIDRARGWNLTGVERVAIASVAQFEISDPACWQIVLFADLSHGATDLFVAGAIPYQDHRLYGFLPPNAPLSARDRLRLEALAGPLLTDSVAEETITGTVTAVFCSARTCSIRVPEEPLARKRAAIWCNSVRNELIAEIAQASADGDLERLESHFRVDPGAPLFTAGGKCTVIVVESLEHARELLRLLPGWEILSAQTSNLQASVFQPTNRRIVTMLATSQMPNYRADIVIRADGGKGGIRPPAAPSPFEAAARQTVLIDFVDDIDHAYVTASQSRARSYSDQGFALRCPEWLLRADTHNTRTPGTRSRGSGRRNNPR